MTEPLKSELRRIPQLTSETLYPSPRTCLPPYCAEFGDLPTCAGTYRHGYVIKCIRI